MIDSVDHIPTQLDGPNAANCIVQLFPSDKEKSLVNKLRVNTGQVMNIDGEDNAVRQ
jgi:hypothetical protein